MTSTIINLSPELIENLQKLADAENLTVTELAEAVLSYYVAEQLYLEPESPNDEEMLEINASIDRANAPGSKWYSDEEFDEALDRGIASRRLR